MTSIQLSDKENQFLLNCVQFYFGQNVLNPPNGIYSCSYQPKQANWIQDFLDKAGFANRLYGNKNSDRNLKRTPILSMNCHLKYVLCKIWSIKKLIFEYFAAKLTPAEGKHISDDICIAPRRRRMTIIAKNVDSKM